MIGRLNHVAIAVHDLDCGIARLPRHARGRAVRAAAAARARRDRRLHHPAEHESRASGATWRGLADRRLPRPQPEGGIHHICYEVDDIGAARDRLIAEGARVLGPPEPKIGAHGKPVIFLHPKDFCGTLVELEQA